MKRFQKYLVTGLSAAGTAVLSAWMALSDWAEALPTDLESFLTLPLMFLIGIAFGYLLAVAFMRR